MKKFISASALLSSFVAQAATAPAALQTASNALPAEMLVRVWGDANFESNVLTNPAKELRKHGIDAENVVIHRDDKSSVNIVVSASQDGSSFSASGDVARVAQLFKQIDRRKISKSDLRTLETIAFNNVGESKAKINGLPKEIQMGSTGVRVLIHTASASKHFTIPLNPIDLATARSIETEAIRVANSTKCCGTGTCSPVELTARCGF